MRLRAATFFFFSFVLLLTTPRLRAQDWLPVTADELAYKDPGGAPAVILYLQEDSDDDKFVQTVYVRAKILTDAGKKYADVSIPYVKDFTHIDHLQARVIRPDGSIVPFNGQTFDKVEMKSRAIRVLERTFTLPEAQPGSIIEYRYQYKFDYPVLIGGYWPLQRELPVRKAHFTLKPYAGPTSRTLRLSWIGIHIPVGLEPARDGMTYVLDTHDLPPLPDEPFSPPDDWSRGIVKFIYTSDEDVTLPPDAYWKKKSSRWGEWTEGFLSHHGNVDKEVASLIQPSMAPEEKLKKLYARAQQVRNLTFERRKSEKEQKKENLKANENVDDVLKRGYGSARDINLLFVAMARSAGFEARLLWAATRDHTPFMKEIVDPAQLRDHVVMVQVNGKPLFLDPATLYCPYGLLNWMDTGVPALPVDKAGADFVTTPDARAADSATSRLGTFKVGDGGDLTGKVTLTYTGLDALRWRLDLRNDDDVERKKELEDVLAKHLTGGAKVTLTQAPQWSVTTGPLVASFDVVIPHAVTQTGKRLLLPVSIFQGNDAHPFPSTQRKLPVYFSYPFAESDDITIEVPAGYQLEATPAPHNSKSDWARYSQTIAFENDRVHLQRNLEMDRYFFEPGQYWSVRAFYDGVRTGDDQTLVMKAAAH